MVHGVYAGTSGNGKDDVGRVFRYEGPDKWTDVGAPDKANTVSALAASSSRPFFTGSIVSSGTEETSKAHAHADPIHPAWRRALFFHGRRSPFDENRKPEEDVGSGLSFGSWRKSRQLAS